MTKPHPGRRTIVTYNRLARDLAALNYVLRTAKPPGMVGDLTLRQFNSIRHDANRAFCRELSMPRFHKIDLTRPMTVADFAILVTRLTLAARMFEQRYAHLTVPESDRDDAGPLTSVDRQISEAADI